MLFGKSILICLLFLFLLPAISGAANRIVIENNETESFNVPSFLYIFEDTENKYKAEQVILAIDDNKFKLNKSSDVNFGFTKSAVWIKFTIINNTEKEKNLVFGLSYPLIDEIDFYELKGYNLQRTIFTGETRNFNTRDVAHRVFLFVLVLEPNVEYTDLIRE